MRKLTSDMNKASTCVCLACEPSPAEHISTLLKNGADKIDELQAKLDEAKKDCDAKQAKIDTLMFEYCHEEMNDSQFLEYEESQRVATPPTKESE